MREFLAHYIRMKRTNFDFVDWEAADKMIEHSPQQFCIWVTNHISKFFGTNKVLYRWIEATDVLCPCSMTPELQEDTCHRFHLLNKERDQFFDEEVQKFSKKLAYLETHLNLQRILLTFVRGKWQVELYDGEMLPDNLMGKAIARGDIVLGNIVEGQLVRA